ncbi:MAG: hypothetical protein L3J56_10405 [Bacteroidales bacterium]|nr:hypothetical protein [Bacteroidales bacterium]
MTKIGLLFNTLTGNCLQWRKLDYIHQNPVKELIVEHPEEYLYSSARNYAGLDAVLDIEMLNLPWKTYN